MNILPVLFLAMIFTLSSCGPEQPPADAAQKQIDSYTKELDSCPEAPAPAKTQARGLSSIAPDDMVIGNPKSTVVMIEYFSPTCPHCFSYHKRIFPDIKAKYIDTGKIAYVIREFIGNKQDLDASTLARCKGGIDTYLKFVDVILSKQDNWAFDKNYREILTNLGSLGGVSPEEFVKCLDDQDKTKTLMENTQLVARIPGFAGTPSFFINGEQFKGRYTVEELSAALDKYLKSTANN